MFSRNVGGLDRAVRLTLGVVLVPSGLLLLGGDHAYGLWIVVLGLIGLASGIIGFCPPYVLLGISTARRRGSTRPGARGTDEGAGMDVHLEP
jgi:hypothetical protein